MQADDIIFCIMWHTWLKVVMAAHTDNVHKEVTSHEGADITITHPMKLYHIATSHMFMAIHIGNSVPLQLDIVIIMSREYTSHPTNS